MVQTPGLYAQAGGTARRRGEARPLWTPASRLASMARAGPSWRRPALTPMTRIRDVLHLERLSRPGGFNPARLVPYDDLVRRELGAPAPVSRWQVARGLVSLLVWGGISMALSLAYGVVVLALAAASRPCRRRPADRARLEEGLEPYLGAYPHKPAMAFFKATEGRHYAALAVQPPALDLGCEDGTITGLHFRGQRFDLGAEYVPSAVGEARRSGRFGLLVGADARRPAFRPAAFQSVALVHVLDHFPEGPEALARAATLVAPGGWLAMSTLAADFWMRHPAVRLLEALGMNRAATRLAQRMARRRDSYNLVPPAVWEEAVRSVGLEPTESRFFLGGRRRGLWTLLFAEFELRGATEVGKALRRLGLFPRPLSRLAVWAGYRIWADAWLDDETVSDGAHLFLLARRPASGPLSTPSPASPVELLACPTCRGKLCEDGVAWRCATCRVVYPVVHEVPVLLPEAARPA